MKFAFKSKLERHLGSENHKIFASNMQALVDVGVEQDFDLHSTAEDDERVTIRVLMCCSSFNSFIARREQWMWVPNLNILFWAMMIMAVVAMIAVVLTMIIAQIGIFQVD